MLVMLMSCPLMSSCWVVLWTLIYFYKNPSCWHTRTGTNSKILMHASEMCMWANMETKHKPGCSHTAHGIHSVSLPIILALLFLHSFPSSLLSLPLHLRYTLAALRVTGCTSFLAVENEFSLSLSYKGFPVWLRLGFHQSVPVVGGRSPLTFTSDSGCAFANLVIQNGCDIGGDDLKSRA